MSIYITKEMKLFSYQLYMATQEFQKIIIFPKLSSQLNQKIDYMIKNLTSIKRKIYCVLKPKSHFFFLISEAKTWLSVI